MKLSSKLSALAAAAALLFCLAAPVLAQPKPAKSDAKPKVAANAANDPDPWQRRLDEVIFDDQPMSDVANFLSAHFESDQTQFATINFIMAADVKDVPITLRLRSVTLDDIFTALSVATKNRVGANKLNEKIVAFELMESPQTASAKPACRAFSLSRYLAGKTDDKEISKALNDLEDALQTAWAMLQSADSSTKIQKPSLNVHGATKLLIVVGQPSAMEVVQQIVGQLNGEPASGGAANLFQDWNNSAASFVPGGIPRTANPFGVAVPGLPGGAAPGNSPSTPPQQGRSLKPRSGAGPEISPSTPPLPGKR